MMFTRGSPKTPEVAAAGLLLHQFAHAVFGKSTRFGHARNLQLRIRHADVRVETAGGCGHGIGGNRRVRRQAVIRTVIGDDFA